MTTKSILQNILKYAIDKKASDIHISWDSFLSYRIKKKIVTLEQAWIIKNDTLNNVLLELMNNNDVRVSEFMKNKDADFAYIHEESWTSFRVNAFYKLWKLAFVLRRIESDPLPMEVLWLPEWVSKFTSAKQWLILITWPTWSWKSTSMISILNEINKTRSEHFLTVEDPVEFVFKNDKSIFSQREVWRDTNTFPTALRAAMREDPDVVVIWEMRDKETVQAALELAETWHLVFSTLHTSSAVQTVQRLLSFFPLDSQNAIRDILADS